MNGTEGQASVEWIGLLALAAILGAALALIAGPRLVGAVRAALVSALSGEGSRARTQAPTAADIADVQLALAAAGTAVTPDAALLALARRNGNLRATEIADRLLLAAARERAPWLGRSRAIGAAAHTASGAAASREGDRIVEIPLAAPTAAWVTVAAQHDALRSALSHHADRADVALNVIDLVPGLRAVRKAGGFLALLVTKLPKSIDHARDAVAMADVVTADDGGVPGGMLSGDVVVSWPVRGRTWHNGREEPNQRIDLGSSTYETAPVYRHFVYFRPTAGGLVLIGEDRHR
jgi:hypothetical protein